MVEAGQRPFDRTGRQIEVGDILKVFHFTGRRRKQYFMYKQVARECELGKTNPSPYFFISHLNLREDDGYYLPLDGAHLNLYEIIQSVDACFHDRPRQPAPSPTTDVDQVAK